MSGLWDPTTNVSSKKALASSFTNVYCIENWVKSGNGNINNKFKIYF